MSQMKFDADSYSRIFDNLYDGLYFVDRNRIITYWNKAAEGISGFSSAEVIGRSCANNILTHIDAKGQNLCHGMCPLAMTIADGKSRENEIFMHRKDGSRVPVSVRISPLTDRDGHVIGAMELFIDLSNYKANELRVSELEKLALLDNLTGIANRRFVEKELLSRIEEQKRFGISSGILFMDIDHFKKFNDTYGHDVGDLVLKFVADTFVNNSRPFDVFGRWGGEEFIGIMRNVSAGELEHLGNRMRVLVENSYIELKEETLHITVSIGATLLRDSDGLETVVKRADTLLYESKKTGRNRLTLG